MRWMILLMAIAVAATGCDNKKKSTDEAAAEGTSAKAASATEPAPGKAAEEPTKAGTAAAAAPAAAPASDVLKDPSKATATAPDTFVVELDTTAGPIKLDITRAWSPNGVDRFYNLVTAGYFTDVAFFRVIPGFMAQVGLHGDPEVNKTWRAANIDDDPVKESNTRGMVSFATAGPNTRTTQFFINFADNNRLDGMGFSPFARVQADSMAIVDKLHGDYGEGAPRGRGPSQGRIHAEGNTYLKAEFPKLDYIKSAKVVTK